MVDDLTAQGVLTWPWREAFSSVPRHAFLPDTVWRVDRETKAVTNLVPLCRDEEPGLPRSGPGGRIFTPWGADYHNGALLALTVGDDGTATGRIVGQAAFMTLRDQRRPRGWISRDVYNEDDAIPASTALRPHDVAGL